MAAAHVASQLFTPAAFVGTSNQTFDAGSPSDGFLSVGAGFRDGGDFTSCLYAGISLSAFSAKLVGGTQGASRVYHTDNVASGSNTLALGNSTGTNLTAAFLASSYSGVDRTTPFDGYTSATGTGLSPSVAVSSPVGDLAVFFFGGFFSSPTGISAASGYTQRGGGFNSTGVGGGGDAAGAGTNTGTASVAAASGFGWSAHGWNLNSAAAGGGGVTVDTGFGEVVAAGFAPTVTVTAHQTVTPDAGQAVLTGFAPTTQTPVSVQPGAGVLSATGFAPIVTAASGVVVQPGAGELSAAGFAPFVALTGHVILQTNAGELTFTGFAPVIEGVEPPPEPEVPSNRAFGRVGSPKWISIGI